MEEMNGGSDRVFQGYVERPVSDDLAIFHDGDTAVAFGKSVPHYKYMGKEFNLENRWTATLVKSDGQWKLAAYHVSGEYAQIEAAVERGWLDRERVVLEALTSIRRAGADFMLTYYADYAARLLNRPERKDDFSSAW